MIAKMILHGNRRNDLDADRFLAHYGSRKEATMPKCATTRMIINADIMMGRINRNIYGHFSEHLGRCIYDGYWVGEDSKIPNTRGVRTDVVEALKTVRVPVLRWPGGCFADDYRWRDGVGPRSERPKQVNVHWGGVTESNHFGTHEFFELCEQIGAAPYICGNVGSGTVREMRDWVEYITFGGDSDMADSRRANGRHEPWRLPYFGIGNENWGCGGRMRPEYYADLYRRYATYVRDLSGGGIYRIACGPNGDDYRWTDVLMREARDVMDGLSLHFYTRVLPEYSENRSATRFGETEWFHLLQQAYRMDELVSRHATIMDRFDPDKRIGLIIDEWGTWHAVEPGTNPGFLYQQNTLRDALVAGVTLNIFNNHCDRVHMGNLAQTVNVLQAVVFTEKDIMVRTPTYHVFDMYRGHQDAQRLALEMEPTVYRFGSRQIPGLSASASRDSSGTIRITLCNIYPEQAVELRCSLRGTDPQTVRATVLTSNDMTAHNAFDETERVVPLALEGTRLANGEITATLPAKSVVLLELDPKEATGS